MAACLLGGFAAQATERYVATNATSTYDGSDWSKAYTNIQAALNAAGNGDTIYLAGHTFRLSTQVVWTTSGVTMRGGYAATNATDKPGPQNAEQWPTVITTSAVARLLNIMNVTNATLEYVTLTGGLPPTPGSVAQTGGGVLIQNSSRVVLSGCILSNNTTYVKYPGTPKGGGLGSVNSDVTLTNCILRKNIARDDHPGAAYAQGGGIWSSGSLAIYDSRILENTVSSTYDGWGGALYFSGTNLVMKNVLVSLNNASHTNAGIYVAGGTGTLVNCTVADQYAGAGVTRAGGTVAMTNCIVWHNNLDVVGTVLAGYCNVGSTNFGGNNISADPLFVAGYYLATNSPCVNTGSDTAENLGLTNLTTRTDGVGDTGTVDMGWHYPAGSVVDQSYVDIYVTTNGSDSNSGTNELQAFRTVTKALSMAQDNSRIHVAAGTYTNGPGLETFPLAITDKMGVQILGAGAAQTMLSNTGAAVRVMTLTRAFRSVVQDLTVTGGRDVRTSAPNGIGGGLYATNSSLLLSGCIVQSNTCSYSWYGSAYGGGIAASASSLTLTNCVVRNNTASGASNTDGRGGGLWSDGLLTIRDSQFLGNISTNMGYGQGGGLYLAGVASLRNVLIAANHASSAKGGDGLCVAGGSASLVNCTVADHPMGQSYAGHGVSQTGGTVALSNCIVWCNTIDIAGAVTAAWCNVGTTNFGGNNISADPRFEYGHYLATNSPSVNAGSDTAANLGLSARTTRADGAGDTGTVDMGWHYAAGPDLTYADIYVAPAPDGNDGNGGTNANQALRTVTKALSLAQDGSRVHVASGTSPFQPSTSMRSSSAISASLIFRPLTSRSPAFGT
jgi:hypothetical protein